ncbi:MAG: HD domain-containing phosphohydrolase [Thermodesulfobacteriota bacterium]
MGRKHTLIVDLNDLVVSLSEALGLVGGNIVNHGKRVAYLALTLADDFDLSPAEFSDLRTAALLHDAGVSRTRTHKKLMQLDWEGAEEHCREGAELLRRFPPFTRACEIIRHHHHKWGRLTRQKMDDRTALLSNLIFLADRIDVLINWKTEIILNRERLESQISELSGAFFNPDAVEVFRKKSRVEVFWLNLYPRHLDRALARFRPAGHVELDLSGLEEVARIFARIVDSKSPYTMDHSYGVAELSRFFGQRLGLSAETVKKLHLAGLVHDLGKLAIPDEILEKPAALTADEFQVVKRHPFETYYILSGLPALEDIRDWASFHHEKSDGSGYPFHLGLHDLGQEHVIVMISDIIQALIQDRPYRTGLARDQVLDILSHLALQQPVLEPLVKLAREDYEYTAHLAQGKESKSDPTSENPVADLG